MAKITTATGSDADLTLEPDGTGDINLTPGTNGDVNIPANKGITFGAAGEKIEGNATKLDIAAAEIDFSIEGSGDINIPANIGLTFASDTEKIESNDTDLTVNSGGAINLTATTDVVIPADVGVTFGTGEKIEGNDTDLTLTSGGDIILDADGADVTLKDGGTTFGSLKQVSGHLVIQPTSTKEIILNHEGGSAALTVETDGDIALTQDIYLAAGKGIYFDGGTTSLNYLGGSDAYEQGTFTPTVSYITTTGSPAYTGNYTRVGNLVQVTIYSTTAVGVATYTVTGGSTTFTLPFPAEAANAAFQSGGAGVFANGNTTDGGILAVQPGGSTVYLFESMSSTANISASVSYRVA